MVRKGVDEGPEEPRATGYCMRVTTLPLVAAQTHYDPARGAAVVSAPEAVAVYDAARP